MTPADLLAALEAETGPSRELDAEIAASVLGGEIVWKQANYTMELYPARKYISSAHIKGYGFEPVLEYTASIDAALTLVPAAVPWEIGQYPDGRGRAWVYEPKRGLRLTGDAHTPALALVIAALRARGVGL